ncbi:Exodeoxyribonuclease V beta chain,exonuclease V subunit beta,exodeoxyribonuclease V, beta subunit,UvrD/REP helicase [Chlamydia poikilotherma]|uniref:RecBCD enzyme subunit RecB n=1 Tax=Chlamydia poikilotherma TaxID=1967783 RepID=A0A3B0PLC7_9CHLA|nr:UvrD-helicase domain-containing protein [Chlamydia poikilotherma]SYX08499.1 Exodeoxyribonuclease V beta chain,exonuclease V subunit beta,exodeoxyribonuclease V, beta subunit,UvrD/REP helicase [Chlamydia poikilotherma]
MKPFDIFNSQTSIYGKYFLEASAGTGKTFTIEQIVLRALLEGSVSHVENILAVTFTNAATNELKLRIQDNLKHALSQLKSALKDPSVSLPPYLKDICDVKQLYMQVRNALATIDRMAIFTIHGFCNHVLQQHFPEMQMTQSNAVLTHTQSVFHHIRKYLSQDFWRSVLFPEQFYLLASRYNSNSKHSSFLTDKLLSSYTLQTFEHLSSKTSTLESLESWHGSIRSKIQDIPEKEFLEQLLQHKESFRKQPFSINEDLLLFVKYLYAEETSIRLFSFSKIVETFHPKNRLARYQPSRAFSYIEETSWFHYTEQFCNVDLIFNTLLRDLQLYLKNHYTWWLSPDESILALEDILLSSRSEEIIKALRKRFQLVLIDEFQDTDRKQWNIFSKLFANDAFSGSLFLIGDPKQSIYEWRNADLATYLKAKSTFPKSSQLHLINNYRSTVKLMEAINFLFCKCSPFLEIPGYEPIEYHPLRSQSSEQFENSQHSPIHFFSYDDTSDQAAWISHTASYLQETHDIPLGRMAILVSDSAQAFDLITHCSIPVAFSKNKSIFHLTETYLLTLAWLEAILHPENYEKIQRVLLSSLFRHNLSDVIEKKEFYSTYFFSLRSYIFDHGLLATFYHFMTMQGEALLKTPQGDLTFQEMERLCAYLNTVSSHPQHQLLYLQYFSETGRWEENLSFSSYSEDTEILKITTIHASKGLEYDVVFCPGLDKSKKNKSASEWIREMYVACTRARKQLFIPIQNSSNSRRNSALTNYVKFEGSHESIMDLAQQFAKEHPAMFSISTIGTDPEFTEPIYKIIPPSTFTLPIAPAKQIFSFSSVKQALDNETSLNDDTTEATASSVLPKGRKTGIIIHKILENISPNFKIPLSKISSIVTNFVKNTHLEGYEEIISKKLMISFSSPLSFATDSFSLKDIVASKIFTEESFLFSNKEQFWQGVIDLFFEHNNRYYIIDWKTSFLGETSSEYSQENLFNYIKEQNLDYQGAIYIHAAKRFLQQFDITSDVEMGFVFIRSVDPEGNGFLRLPNQKMPNPIVNQKYPVYH